MNRRSFASSLVKTLLTVSAAGAALPAATASPVVGTSTTITYCLQQLRFVGSALRKYRWSDRPEIEYDDVNDALEARGMSLLDWAPKPDGEVARIYISDTSQLRSFCGFKDTPRVSPIPPLKLTDLEFLSRICVS